MFDTATAQELAEGTLNFGSPGVWHCTAHETSNTVGRDCPWCVSESMSPAQFEMWLRSQ